jgi:hypothetical protein
MHYGVESLRKIDDFNELVTEAGHTIHMLVNECENRDKYDVNDYLANAQAILDLIQDRSEQLENEE